MTLGLSMEKGQRVTSRFVRVGVLAAALALGVGVTSTSGASGLTIGGSVQSVNVAGHSFTLKLAATGKVVTVDTLATTKVLIASNGSMQVGSLSAVKTGDTVVATGAMVGTVFDAIVIDATTTTGPPSPSGLGAGAGGVTSGMGGNIKKINAGAHSFVLKTDVSPSVGETGKTYVIFTNSSTSFRSTTGKVEGFSALKVGEHVGVAGSAVKGGFAATNVAIRLAH